MFHKSKGLKVSHVVFLGARRISKLVKILLDFKNKHSAKSDEAFSYPGIRRFLHLLYFLPFRPESH